MLVMTPATEGLFDAEEIKAHWVCGEAILVFDRLGGVHMIGMRTTK
ncbi:hypothetical protein [Roseibium sp.]